MVGKLHGDGDFDALEGIRVLVEEEVVVVVGRLLGDGDLMLAGSTIVLLTQAGHEQCHFEWNQQAHRHPLY